MVGAFRATVVDRRGEGTDGMLSFRESEQALTLVDRLCPEGRCAFLRSRAEELRKRLAGFTEPAGVVPLVTSGDCGARAPAIDESIQARVVYDLTRLAPTWSVRTLLHSSTPASRLLELTNGTLRITVSISYLATSDDAARSLQCRLRTIAMPRFRRVMGIGDEAFVLSSSSLMFRAGRLLLQVDASDMSLDTERTIAMRVLASIAAAAAGR